MCRSTPVMQHNNVYLYVPGILAVPQSPARLPLKEDTDGTCLAAGTAGAKRPLAGSWSRPVARAAAVRRAAAPADACPVRRRVDRRQRGRRAPARARSLPGCLLPPRRYRGRVLEDSQRTTSHRDLGTTAWYTVRAGEQSKPRAAWQHTGLPEYAGELKGRAAFAWRAMDAFYEEDERILGHAADMYHRIDIRPASRRRRSAPAGWSSRTRPAAGAVRVRLRSRWYVPRPTLTRRRSPRCRSRPSAPTRGCAATTTSADGAGLLVLPPGPARGRTHQRPHLVRSRQGRGEFGRQAATAGAGAGCDRPRRGP